MSGPKRPPADPVVSPRRSESLWPGRVIAAAAGAGIVLAAIALRDGLLFRRRPPPPPLRGWRAVVVRRLRGEDG